MIPETLAIGPTLRWLALALGGVFLFAVAVVTAGDAIFKRLQRKAIQRSLSKIKWMPLVALCLSFFLLTSQMAFAQTPNPTPKQLRAAQYQKLFLLVNGFLAQVNKNCKTPACAQAAEDGLALITDAQDKLQEGQFLEDESTRKQFHQKLEGALTRARTALIEDADAKRATTKSSKNLPEVPSCPVPTRAATTKNGRVVLANLPDPYMCNECWEAFEVLAEICALYTIVSPEAALICLASATIGFARCIEDWCGDTIWTNP